MRSALTAIALMGAIYFYPQIATSTSSPCAALAEKVYAYEARKDPSLRDNAFAYAAKSLLGESLVIMAMRQQRPNTPPALSCVAAFYNLGLLDEPILTRAQKT